MNLRIGSARTLVAFLLEVVRDEGQVEYDLETGSLVRVRQRYFFLPGSDSGVIGPCATVAELVRLEGQRVDPGSDRGARESGSAEEWRCFGEIWDLTGDCAELEDKDFDDRLARVAAP